MKDTMRVGGKNMGEGRNADVMEMGGVDTVNGGNADLTSMASKIGIGGSHTLAAIDLSYAIQVTDTETKEKKAKTLIHPISFRIKPREMVAIMGASGAGKSTLLDILSQRVPFSQVDGDFVLDEKPIVPKEFKRMSGYVMQDDALYPLLTVRETLQFAAELRIPNVSKAFSIYGGKDRFDDVTLQYPSLFKAEIRADKYTLVEETIKQLKLGRCAETRIGNEIHRGVSGGEKRRVSIGVDTVQQPTIIFLDEPTSGLDSTTALTIAETLSDMCKRNRTVAMTIHQPSTRVLDVFDKVMFLSRGRMVYYGRPSGLPGYCTDLGKAPPLYSNIAEFFLEVVDEYEAADRVEDLSNHHQLMLRMREPSQIQVLGPFGINLDYRKGITKYKCYWAKKRFGGKKLESANSHSLLEVRTRVLDDAKKESSKPLELTREHDYANSTVRETLILVRRQWLNVLRTPELALVRIMVACIVSLALGSLYWSSNTNTAGLRERASYFAFALALFIFTSLEALPIFLQEQSIYTREHSRGAYRVISYSLANFLIYIPVFAAMSVVFTSISYFMIDLPPSGFGFQIMAIFFVLLSSNAFATFVSGIAPDPLTGNGAGTAMLAFMFLFSGFFIPFDDIPPGWKWFSALSLFKYPLEGMVLNMLDEEVSEGRISQEVADSFAGEFGMQDSDKWSVVYGSICFVVGFRLLFFIALVTKHSGARK